MQIWVGKLRLRCYSTPLGTVNVQAPLCSEPNQGCDAGFARRGVCQVNPALTQILILTNTQTPTLVRAITVTVTVPDLWSTY